MTCDCALYGASELKYKGDTLMVCKIGYAPYGAGKRNTRERWLLAIFFSVRSVRKSVLYCTVGTFFPEPIVPQVRMVGKVYGKVVGLRFHIFINRTVVFE